LGEISKRQRSQAAERGLGHCRLYLTCWIVWARKIVSGAVSGPSFRALLNTRLGTIVITPRNNTQFGCLTLTLWVLQVLKKFEKIPHYYIHNFGAHGWRVVQKWKRTSWQVLEDAMLLETPRGGLQNDVLMLHWPCPKNKTKTARAGAWCGALLWLGFL